jgi:hypothetical protein
VADKIVQVLLAIARRWNDLYGIGRDMIAIQLDLPSKQPEEALNDTWVLGYCFGMLVRWRSGPSSTSIPRG